MCQIDVEQNFILFRAPQPKEMLIKKIMVFTVHFTLYREFQCEHMPFSSHGRIFRNLPTLGDETTHLHTPTPGSVTFLPRLYPPSNAC